jgi:formylmethanofuran dehydrogenase subunit C
MIALTLKEAPTVPLEAEVISPDVIGTLSLDEVRALPVFHGKRQRRLDDYFSIEGAPGEEIALAGDLQKVKWIGRGMTRGSLRIQGDVGMHLGAYMKGGRIDVTGNASDWVGGEMSGGSIRVSGNAGGQIGAAYRGSHTGMSDGTIIIGGGAGLEVGMRMKRGLIVIGGKARDFAGLQMKGGTIVLGGGAELRTGAWMMRGTIVSLAPIPVMPTFAYASTYTPTFMRLLSRHLAALGFTLPCDEFQGAYRRYNGDASVPGKGELFVWQVHA